MVPTNRKNTPFYQTTGRKHTCDESASVQQVVMMQSCRTLHRWKLTAVASPQHASTRGLSTRQCNIEHFLLYETSYN